MVADDLALSLAERYVPRGAAILDPFCGSGRLLVAASHADLRVGLDANPLACLLTRAKLAKADPLILREVVAGMEQARDRTRAPINFQWMRGRVEWFSPTAAAELGAIVAWINTLQLGNAELMVTAAALSATARESSFARQAGWKLHRLKAEERAAFAVSPWDRFARRMRYCLAELASAPPIRGNVQVLQTDSRELKNGVGRILSPGRFDVVLTSPPYGDSRTTVQYGAASALCLDVISRIERLEHLAAPGCEIDATCLGGRARPSSWSCELKPYWAGSRNSRSGRMVERFLTDYADVCTGIGDCLNPGGKAILIVGRRSTGGFRLKLDQFTADHMERQGFAIVAREERAFQQKRVPRQVNRFARAHSAAQREKGLLKTMTSEIILILEKPSARSGFKRSKASAEAVQRFCGID